MLHKQLLAILMLALVLAIQPAISTQRALCTFKALVPKLDKPKVLTGRIEQKEAPSSSTHLKAKVNSRLKNRVHKMAPASLLAGKANADKRSSLQAKIKETTLKAQAKSGLGVIGIKFRIDGGNPPEIIRVFDTMPAATKGLQVGDLIDAVDGVSTNERDRAEVYNMIAGTPGTNVTLKLRRADDEIAVTVSRIDLDDISDPALKDEYMKTP
jgi:C-terminal processing protease CtpA/Prc